MQQFDVYANPSVTTRAAYPFIFDIQNQNISELATRLVIPLARKADLRDQRLKRLTPTIEYEVEELLLLVPQLTSVQAKMLKHPIGFLSHLREAIVAALDFLVRGI